jgi:hypothetical protein
MEPTPYPPSPPLSGSPDHNLYGNHNNQPSFDEEEAVLREHSTFQQAPGQEYYLVDFNWFEKWQAWVQGQGDACAEMPGAIPNENLTSEKTADPADRYCYPRVSKSLVVGFDYTVTTQSVWQHLVHWYGGGPEICRPCVHSNFGPSLAVHPFRLEVAKYATGPTARIEVCKANTVLQMRVQACAALGIEDSDELAVFEVLFGTCSDEPLAMDSIAAEVITDEGTLVIQAIPGAKQQKVAAKVSLARLPTKAQLAAAATGTPSLTRPGGMADKPPRKSGFNLTSRLARGTGIHHGSSEKSRRRSNDRHQQLLRQTQGFQPVDTTGTRPSAGSHRHPFGGSDRGPTDKFEAKRRKSHPASQGIRRPPLPVKTTAQAHPRRAGQSNATGEGDAYAFAAEGGEGSRAPRKQASRYTMGTVFNMNKRKATAPGTELGVGDVLQQSMRREGANVPRLASIRGQPARRVTRAAAAGDPAAHWTDGNHNGANTYEGSRRSSRIQ